MPKTLILFAALACAILLSVFIPTPNVKNAGAAKMVLVIILTVSLKALFEWLWPKIFKK
jgi:hypothetical protein